MLPILLSHYNILVFTISFLIAIVAVLRYFSVSIFSRVSWRSILFLVIAFGIAQAVLLSYGQYMAWSSNELGREFLSLPLPAETPLPIFLEWSRVLFSHHLGYFSFYVLGRFILPMVILFALTGFFSFLLSLRARFYPINFREGDIAAIATALLVAGWPGVMVLVPFGFIFTVIIALIARLYGIERILLPPAFLLTAPLAFIFVVPVLKYLHLYTLLKI